MEETWNRKKINRLLNAEPEVLEAFWDQYVPVLYTLLYYQVGADEKLTVDLIGETLQQALRNISQFNPTQESLFQWLKQQTRQARDTILEHRQLKPHRPWAWSQLPADIQKSLSLLRSEPLNEKVYGNPYVQEIVQSTLAELDTSNRKLLILRYCHLDTEEHIAEEMRCGIEQVQNQLYRSRHSFRRVFFQLLSSANTGFSEETTTGDIEILDTNMEKLLSSTPMHQPMNKSHTELIRSRFISTAEEIAASQPADQNGKYKSPAVLLGGLFLVLMIVLAVVYIAIQKSDKTAPTEPTPVTQTEKAKPLKEEPSPKNPQSPSKNNIEQEEIELVMEMARTGNIDALLELLKSGRRTTQIATAIILGQQAGPEAIEPLEQAELQWYPEQKADNPFDQAINQILSRHPELVPKANPEDNKTSEDDTEETVKKEPLKEPQKHPPLSGAVTDFSSQPLANAILELNENPLFSNTSTVRNISTTKTDPKGRYTLAKSYEGPAYLTVKDQNSESLSTRRSLLCQKGANRTINFGGRPSLTGNLIVDGIALSNQTLYLSDTLILDQSSYLQETKTDADGNFYFTGVPAGDYLLLNLGLDKRIHRLDNIKMPSREIFNVNIDIVTAGVILAYHEDSQPPVVASAELVYMALPPDNMKSIKAAISQDGSVYFENVIPGAYMVRVQLDNGIWLQQDVEVALGPDDTIVALNTISEEAEFATLSGQLISISPVDLFLTSPNQQIHVDLSPRADGSFEIPSIPADIYTLGTYVHNQFVEFFEVDLLTEAENSLDIAPEEMTQSVSPLNVIVSNTKALIISGAEVWLTGEEHIINSTSTGKGTFLVVPPGKYTLSVAYPGFPTHTQEVEVLPSSLTANPQRVMVELQ